MMRRLKTLGALGALTLTLSIAAPAAGQNGATVALAARSGDVDRVHTLLREGADVNAALGDGMSALHWAAELGDEELVDVLIRAGAVVESATRIGAYRPLHIATRNGHPGVVKALIEAGADVQARTDPSGSTPLHLGATAGNADVVRTLLAAGADPNAREGRWSQTPLIFAAAWNRVEAIEALVEGGADPDLASDVVDFEVMRRYDQAANRRQEEVLDAFTNGGEWAPTSAQVQAAVRAARQVYEGDPPPAREEADDRGFSRGEPRIQTKGGLTPLLHAARQGHLESIETLLDLGADIDKIGGGDGTTPLLIATINGQFDAAILLLERGADPNIASSLNGATPLFAAINSEWQPRTRYPQPQERAQQRHGYLQMAEALLEAGADPDARMRMHPWYMEYTGCGNSQCGLIDMDGATPFLRAAYATDVEAMRLLHEWGADPYIATTAPAPRPSRDERRRAEELGRLTDVDEFAALDDSAQASAVAAIWFDLPDSVKADIPEEEVRAKAADYREVIIEHAQRQDSVRALEPDPSGLPPVPEGGPAVYAIHAASGVGYGEGFAGNAHRHVENGWLPSIKFLIEEIGMDVNLRDHNGYTAMHHAAARGDNESILYLVEMGGDVTAISRRGQTTADMANGPVSRVSPIPETVALLESLGSANSNNCLTCEQ